MKLDYKLERRSTYPIHCFILSLKSKNIFATLAPRLSIMWIDMGHDVSDALFEVVNGVVIGVEGAGAIPFTIEITMALQYVVAMNGNQELDTVLMSVVHHIIETIQNLIAIPLCGTVSFQTRKTIDRSALWIARLSYNGVEKKISKRNCFLTIKPNAKNFNSCLLQLRKQGFLLVRSQARCIIEV